MIKIKVEGQEQQVNMFLYDLHQRPYMKPYQLGSQINEDGEMCATYYVKHQPDQRMKVVEMTTAEGVKIEVPMMDLIQVEIEEGVKVFAGKVFDIFA